MICPLQTYNNFMPKNYVNFSSKKQFYYNKVLLTWASYKIMHLAWEKKIVILKKSWFTSQGQESFKHLPYTFVQYASEVFSYTVETDSYLMKKVNIHKIQPVKGTNIKDKKNQSIYAVKMAFLERLSLQVKKAKNATSNSFVFFSSANYFKSCCFVILTYSEIGSKLFLFAEPSASGKRKEKILYLLDREQCMPRARSEHS